MFIQLKHSRYISLNVTVKCPNFVLGFWFQIFWIKKCSVNYQKIVFIKKTHTHTEKRSESYGGDVCRVVVKRREASKFWNQERSESYKLQVVEVLIFSAIMAHRFTGGRIGTTSHGDGGDVCRPRAPFQKMGY